GVCWITLLQHIHQSNPSPFRAHDDFPSTVHKGQITRTGLSGEMWGTPWSRRIARDVRIVTSLSAIVKHDSPENEIPPSRYFIDRHACNCRYGSGDTGPFQRRRCGRAAVRYLL